MIKTYEKKPVGYYAYLVLSKRIKDRLGKAKKDVRVYPIYDKNLEVIGIKVTAMINYDNKWIDSMIRQTLHLIEAA